MKTCVVKRSVGWIVLLWTACAAMPLHASEIDPLTIAMVQSRGGSYYEPAGRTMVIRGQPLRLFIRIRNTSKAAVLVRVSPERAYSIELKDEAGLTSMVKRKETGHETVDDLRVRLSPDEEKIIPMEINRDTWEGVPNVTAGKDSKYTVRVVYENANGRNVYSESYTLIFRIRE